MIRLTLGPDLWVGDSHSLKLAQSVNVNAIFNVAHDLSQFGCDSSTRPLMMKLASRGVKYIHMGLINGPGNEVIDYCAVVLFLKGMMQRYKSVLVYDHDGGLALVVGAMYTNLVEGQQRLTPSTWSHWLTWDECVADYSALSCKLPKVHEVHIEIFNRMPWGVLAVL